MKQKEKLLLRYLIDHRKEYVTSQRLASECYYLIGQSVITCSGSKS